MAEVIGTFIVVVFATGSIVIDAKMNGILGIPFIALVPFVGVLLVCICLEKSQWHILILQLHSDI